MKKYLFLISILILVSCKNKTEKSEHPTRDLLMPQIVEAYENEQWDKIILLSDSLIKSGEPHDDLAILFGQALVKTGNVEKAIVVLRNEIDNPNSTTEKHYLYCELGNTYLLLKDYDNAYSSYEESIKLQPSYVSPMVGLADLFEKKGDIQSALFHYTKAASLFYEHKYKDELMATGLHMIEIAPENSNSWQVLAKGYNLIEEYDKEEECWKRRISILMDGQDAVTDKDKKESIISSMIELAVAQYNQDKIDKCMESIQWLRNNTKSLGDWENDIQRLEQSCKEKLE